MKNYRFPVMFLVDDGQGEIILDGSETTAPDDIFNIKEWDEKIFDDFDPDIISLWLDHYDVEEIDADQNGIITYDEFTTWYNANEPW